jgi:hypothetical protein
MTIKIKDMTLDLGDYAKVEITTVGDSFNMIVTGPSPIPALTVKYWCDIHQCPDTVCQCGNKVNALD